MLSSFFQMVNPLGMYWSLKFFLVKERRMRGIGFVSIYSNKTFHVIDIKVSVFSHALGKGLNCPSPLSALCSHLASIYREGEASLQCFQRSDGKALELTSTETCATIQAEEKEEKQSVQKQRIIEDPELSGTHKDHGSPAPGSEQGSPKNTMCLRALQTLLELCQVGAGTTALGSGCQGVHSVQ